jgi:site-specific recombinase XerD
MLSKFFDSPRRIKKLQDGPAGPLIESFARTLSEAGYTRTTAREHLRAAEHFLYWIRGHDMAVREVNEQALANFASHLRQCRCPHYGHAHQVDVICGARLFVSHLRDVGAIAASVCKDPEDPDLLVTFSQWMRQQRGTRETTLDSYKIYLRELLKRLENEPKRFDAGILRGFVLEKSRSSGWGAAKACTTALRMFLRFLIVNGYCAVGLEAAIPTLAHWRLATLPRSLQPEDVERLIASCDRSSSVGRRDRAILLLLARLGLRAGDIVHLRLSDIDWKNAWIQFCGKSRRQTQLPLTQEVGQAIVDYLQDGRPPSSADTVFLRCRAPFRSLGPNGAISMIVVRALLRAGVVRPSRGAAHLLRHSIATSMLHEGASLEDIAGILRHSSIETTQIYAKVDITTLRAIAQPWPEVESC